MNNAKSRELYDRAVAVIPEQTMTFAKAAHNYPADWAPRYLKSASGCEVVDVDDNRFVDYTMALGPMILGYNYPRVTEAVIGQLRAGGIFSLPHYLEVELAETLTRIIPCAERVRFYKTGAEVTSLAVRLARSLTGRRHVLQNGYHGHHEWYSWVLRDSGTLPDNKEYTHTFAYNNLAAIESLIASHPDDVAAIILETAFEAPQHQFLHRLRELCDRHGIVLIFDEMWTGFRFGLGGFQQFIGVTPDVAVFSKAIANGLPIAVIAGRQSVMDRFANVWGFTTFGGDTLAIRAALETIAEIRERDVVAHINRIGASLKAGIASLVREGGLDGVIGVSGYDCRFKLTLTAAGDPKRVLQEQFLRDGILWNNLFVPSFSHSDSHVARTLESFERGLRLLAD